MTPITIGTKIRLRTSWWTLRLRPSEDLWVRDFRCLSTGYRYLVARSLTAPIPQDGMLNNTDYPGMAWVDADRIEVIP